MIIPPSDHTATRLASVGMPGWLRSEQVAGLDRNRWLTSSESAIIEHAIWLYQCCSLSLREVELIQAARGVVVSCESIREWDLRLGRLFANAPKRRRPRPGDKWFLDGTVNLIGRKRNEMSWPSGLPTRCASAWKKGSDSNSVQVHGDLRW
jgi:hypothetical protein